MCKDWYKKLLVLGLALAMVFLLTTGAQAQSPYAGTKKCNDCHGDEADFAGTQWPEWLNTKHAQIYRDPDLPAIGQTTGVVPDADFKSGLKSGVQSQFFQVRCQRAHFRVRFRGGHGH
jgi:hypothetical protein